MSRRWRVGLAALALLTGVGLVTAGGWIHLKARLSQTLLTHAWHRTQQSDLQRVS